MKLTTPNDLKLTSEAFDSLVQKEVDVLLPAIEKQLSALPKTNYSGNTYRVIQVNLTQLGIEKLYKITLERIIAMYKKAGWQKVTYGRYKKYEFKPSGDFFFGDTNFWGSYAETLGLPGRTVSILELTFHM